MTPNSVLSDSSPQTLGCGARRFLPFLRSYSFVFILVSLWHHFSAFLKIWWIVLGKQQVFLDKDNDYCEKSNILRYKLTFAFSIDPKIVCFHCSIRWICRSKLYFTNVFPLSLLLKPQEGDIYNCHSSFIITTFSLISLDWLTSCLQMMSLMRSCD